MNLLPQELKNQIFSFLSYKEVYNYCQKSNCSSTLLLQNLTENLGFDVKQIWNLRSLPSLPNYVRTLAYFGIVLPGSEQFLDLKVCYHLAIEAHNYDLIDHLGQLLGYTIQRITKDVGNYIYPVILYLDRRLKNSQLIGYFNQVVEGEVPDIDNAFIIYNCLFLALVMGQQDLFNFMLREYGFECVVNEILAFYYIYTSNYDALISYKISSDINHNFSSFLRTAGRIVPNISYPIASLLLSKINLQYFIDLSPVYLSSRLVIYFLALIWQDHREILQSFILQQPQKFLSLLYPPFITYMLVNTLNLNKNKFWKSKIDHPGKHNSENLIIWKIYLHESITS